MVLKCIESNCKTAKILTLNVIFFFQQRGKRGYGQLTDECQQLRKQETAGKRIAKIKEQEVDQFFFKNQKLMIFQQFCFNT